MCCSEGGCGINPIYVSIAITAARISSLQIPNTPVVTTIPATSDTPLIIATTTGDSDMAIDAAEFEVIKEIISKEDDSQELSDALLKIKNSGSSITFRNNPDPDGEYDLGASYYDETNGILDAGQVIVIEIARETIMKKAEEWGVTENEIIAEVVIHEILHPGAGTKVQTFHEPYNGVGPTPGFYGDIYGHVGSPPSEVDIGVQQRDAYKDIFGKEPPGYVETVSGSQTPPSQLETIRTNPVFYDYYEGLWNTLNATIQYPTFEVTWEGA